MAVNDPNYRYATQTWEADGVRTQYDIAFDGGYIRQSDVVAFSVLVDPSTGLTSDRQIHALTFLSESEDPETQWKTASVEITPAVAAGRRVVIFRSTEKSVPLVDYTNGSILTEKNLDLANEQAIFAIAEIMDGLNAAAIDIQSQVQEVVDMNMLVNSVYESVLQLLASGGIVSVNPRVWGDVGNGEDTDFPLVGADVDGSAFYDTYLDGVGLEPSIDYTVVMGETSADTVLRFTTAPPLGVRWFTVLRGYAKPYTGPQPLTTLRIPVLAVPGDTFFIDQAVEFALLQCTNVAGCAVTVKLIPEEGDSATKMGTGSYVSLKQVGAGQIVIDADPDVTVVCPEGYLPKSRDAGSIITLVCNAGDTNEWTLAGDLAIDLDYATGGARTKFNKTLAAAFSSSATALATVTGCTANVAAGKTYRVRFTGTYQTAATTTGCSLAVRTSDTATGDINGRCAGAITSSAAATALAVPIYALTGAGSLLTTTGVSAINTPHWLEYEAVFVCTANGTLSLQFGSEVAASAAQINSGSCFSVEEMEITP